MSNTHNNPDDVIEGTEEDIRHGAEMLAIPTKVQPSGSERFRMASRLADHLLQSHNPIEAYVILKNITEVSGVAMEALKDGAIGGVTGKEELIFGATCSLRSVREYEYDDTTITKLEAEMAVIKKNLAERKEFLRKLKMEVADTSSGEILRPAKCVKDGSTIAVTLPK